MAPPADSRAPSGSPAPLLMHLGWTADRLKLDLADGRAPTVPLTWYPRLLHATAQGRANWRPISHGRGIHWADLHEDLGVDGLIAGRRSGESHASLARWLAARASGERSAQRVDIGTTPSCASTAYDG